MMGANQRRLRQLFEAALNLGMRRSDAEFYARQALARELEDGEWRIVPRSTEALANDYP